MIWGTKRVTPGKTSCSLDDVKFAVRSLAGQASERRSTFFNLFFMLSLSPAPMLKRNQVPAGLSKVEMEIPANSCCITSASGTGKDGLPGDQSSRLSLCSSK
jgi:hypothetical protein